MTTRAGLGSGATSSVRLASRGTHDIDWEHRGRDNRRASLQRARDRDPKLLRAKERARRRARSTAHWPPRSTIDMRLLR